MTEPRPGQETDPDATSEGPGGTPEGHTPERPAIDEYGTPGTPAAGLSPSTPHAADAEAHDAHGAGHDAHGAAHDVHADEHGDEHGEPPPGPIDWGAWAVSLVGLAAGGAVALVIGQVLAHG
jgi:hypothetical protein